MKNHKLLVLAGCLWASSLPAQTADEYVAMGRTNLAAHNLVTANADFNAALNQSPTNQAANALAAVTRLLLVPQQPPGSNFLNRIGFSAAGRDIYNWAATLPQDTNGNTVMPANFNSSEAISFCRTNVMPALAASRTNLARITNPAFTLSLTADETSIESVTVDYGDILLLQALERAAEFLGYTLNAHNFSVVINHLKDLGDSDTLTVQRVLSDYPSLLNQSNASDLAASKGAFTNAIILYQQASDFIRNTRPAGAQRLFNLDTNDLAVEAEFRTQLTNALLSLNGPVRFDTNVPFSLNLSNYFAGTKSLRSLVPRFIGDRYVINTLPDYTFSGILVDAPACDVEAMLRKMWDRPTAGIYTGDVYGQYGFGNVYAGVFAAFLGTNLQAAIIGYDQNLPSGAFMQFTVHDGGDWYFETNGTSDQGGPFLVSSHGSFNHDGSFYGQFDYSHTNGAYWFSQYLNGNFSSPLGNFQGAAGLYSGSWSGGESGKLYGILSADGFVYFCGFSPLGDVTGGGMGELDSINHFISTMTDGTFVSGTLNPSAHTMSGTFTNSQTSGQWNLSRSAFAPFDVPPVITVPPTNKTVPLGTNVTFSVTATGSPPLCYQWFSNDVAIAHATNTSLVLSNVTYACATNYSVSVRNVAGETNATATLTVVPETVKPTIQILTPTAGLQVSNATYTATGVAGDNVQISNVWYQLNTNDWDLTSLSTGGTNWTAANLALTPGTNVIRAYAVDTSGNVSTTNSVSFVYILSASLTVNINGNGTVNPNYNGASLQIGKSYSMTATAGTGFQFTGWTGSFATNGATLTFTMASNLVFTANFADVTRPTLTISSPASGQRVSNAVFTVTGTATDNWMITNVWCQIVGNDWTNATSANHWTNWSAANLPLTPGTNVLLAYAVDTTGNRSTTNSVSFQYVVSAPLQVQLAGLGTINPNYSNAVLAIGQSYTLTASPGSGFTFTNWSGGTSLPLAVLTNGTTVRFTMETNLILQANFVDTTKPTLSITNLTSGQRVSNDTFTVKGTASDNWMITNVWCQIVGNDWTNATSANHWTNWLAANLPLTPGTNVLLAYAVDTTGNRSTTNSVSFQYVVSAPLQVQLAGLGTINPNYSNAVLAIGQSYTLTASPGSGFTFTNWSGGTGLPLEWLTNGTTVRFVMESNLILQANFVDTTKPTLSVTNLTSGQRVSNATFTVKGTASDNWMITNVWCQVVGNDWTNATSANRWTNWSAADLPLTPGTNVLLAYAVDTTGNRSTTNTVSFQYVVTNQLGVRAVGLGTISPNYSNAWLEIGRNYSMTATPGSGFLFTNWTISTNWIGGMMTNKATVQFMMESNLTLQVSFADVTKPALTITAPTSGQHLTNALANVKGTASDNWKVTNVWYQLNTNAWSLATSTNGWTNWTVTLPLVAGTNSIKAYAVDLGANGSTTNSVSFVSSNTFTLQLGITAGELMTSNGLGFNLQVSPGLNGRIEASTNLVNWTTLTNFVGTNTTIYFRDPAAGNLNLRFYRAVTP